jgi:hypothetical protein
MTGDYFTGHIIPESKSAHSRGWTGKTIMYGKTVATILGIALVAWALVGLVVGANRGLLPITDDYSIQFVCGLALIGGAYIWRRPITTIVVVTAVIFGIDYLLPAGD